MGSMSVNFAEVEGGFEPVPEGRYPVLIERVEVRESKSSDNDYLNWELKITDEDYEDQRLWMITSLSPKAMFRLKDVFLALGVIEGEEEDFDLEWDDDVDITPEEGPLLTNPDVEGMEAVAIVTNEVYEGKERNRVDELAAAGTGSSSGGKKKSGSKARKASGSKGKASRRRKLR